MANRRCVLMFIREVALFTTSICLLTLFTLLNYVQQSSEMPRVNIDKNNLAENKTNYFYPTSNSMQVTSNLVLIDGQKMHEQHEQRERSEKKRQLFPENMQTKRTTKLRADEARSLNAEIDLARHPKKMHILPEDPRMVANDNDHDIDLDGTGRLRTAGERVEKKLILEHLENLQELEKQTSRSSIRTREILSHLQSIEDQLESNIKGINQNPSHGKHTAKQ